MIGETGERKSAVATPDGKSRKKKKKKKKYGWRYALESRGMKVNRRKTEYMCVNERQDNSSGTVKMQEKRWRKWRISNTWAQLYKVMESAEEK